jgi:membrane protein required for colicin V production
MEVTIFDIIIISVVCLSTIFGASKGLLYSLVTFLGIILTIIGVIFVYPNITFLLGDYITNVLMLKISSIALSYFICLTAISFLNSMILKITTVLRGGFTDKILGFIFGFVRGGAVALVIYWGVLIFNNPSFLESSDTNYLRDQLEKGEKPDFIGESETVAILDKITTITIELLPKLSENLEKLQENKENTGKKV